jgi:hypothetical protein
MNDSIFYAIGKKQSGPVSVDFLRNLAAKGEFNRNDWLWQPGMAEWQPATAIPEIFAGLHSDLVPDEPVRRVMPPPLPDEAPSTPTREGSAMSGSLFYAIDGKPYGPVAISVLRELAVKGELNRTDKIWCEGMAQWQAAESIGGIFEGLPPDLEPLSGTCSETPTDASRSINPEAKNQDTYLPAIEKTVATGKAVSKIVRQKTSNRYARFNSSLPKPLQNKELSPGKALAVFGIVAALVLGYIIVSVRPLQPRQGGATARGSRHSAAIAG